MKSKKKQPVPFTRMRYGTDELLLSGPIYPELIPVEFEIPIQGPVTAIERERAVSEVTEILTGQLPLKSGSIQLRIGNVPAELRTDRTKPARSGRALNEWLDDLKRLLAKLPTAPDKSDIYEEITE